MNIYTSYYTKAVKLNPAKYEFIQISNSTPKDWSLPITKMSSVVPSWSLVDNYKHQKIDEDEYTEAYVSELNSRVNDVLADVQIIRYKAQFKHVVILCYEKTGFCHRHVLSRLLNKYFDLNIKEL